MGKNKKLFVTLSVIFAVILISIVSILIYLYVFAHNNKLDCSRINDGVEENFYFEFNMFKKIKKVTQGVKITYNFEQSAIEEYEQAKTRGKDVKLEGKSVIYFFDDINPDYEIPNTLNKVKDMYESLKYVCKVVKK